VVICFGEAAGSKRPDLVPDHPLCCLKFHGSVQEPIISFQAAQAKEESNAANIEGTSKVAGIQKQK